MSARKLTITRAELAEVIRRRREPFDGFTVDRDPARHAAGVAQLERDLGTGGALRLSRPVTEADVVRLAVEQAQAAEAHAQRVERRVQELEEAFRTPEALAERLTGHTGMLELLGRPERRPSHEPVRVDLGDDDPASPWRSVFGPRRPDHGQA